MPAFCIVNDAAQKLKQAFHDGEITINDLYNATSDKRLATFSKYADKELAHYLNSQFEKALVSKNVTNSLKTFFAKGLDPKDVKAKSLIERIDELEKTGFVDANGNYLADLVDAKLGVHLTPEQLKTVSEKASKLEGLYAKKHPVMGSLPDIEYWQAVSDLENYIKGLNPSSPLAILMSTVTRGNLLMSGGGPSTNIISNKVNAAFMALQRRIAERGVAGPNAEITKAFVEYNLNVFARTGKDLSRMPNFASAVETQMAEGLSHAQGPGIGRKIVRVVYEDGVYKWMYGADDVVTATTAFIDRADLVALRMAKDEGLTGQALKERHAQLLQEALSLEPTGNGETIRNIAVQDALTTTYTNNAKYAQMLLEWRNSMNKATGNWKLGDVVIPFVKTVTNVVRLGVEMSGAGLVEGLAKLPGAIRSAKLGDTRPMADVVSLWVKTGVGMTAALLLANATNPEDYMPDYIVASPKDRERAKMLNASYNSVRIGDVWISLDFLGPIATPYVGFMNGRKGVDVVDSLSRYIAGEAMQLTKMPGLPNLSDITQGTEKTFTGISQGKGLMPVAEGAAQVVEGRAVPTIGGHFAQATDTVQRETSQTPFGKVAAQIPGLRQMVLPPKIGQLTGEQVAADPAWMTLIFGSRLKMAEDDPVVAEVNRLILAGYPPTTADIQTSYDAFKDIKTQLTRDQYTQVLEAYGKGYNSAASRKMESPSWGRKTDEQKKDDLDTIRKDSVDDAIKLAKKLGYKKPKK